MVKDNQKTLDGVENIQVRANNLLNLCTGIFPSIRNLENKRFLDIDVEMVDL